MGRKKGRREKSSAKEEEEGKENISAKEEG